VDQRTRLKINLISREFEVEGSEAFVRSYAERFEELLGAMTALPPVEEPPLPAAENRPKASLGDFGEFVQHLPKSSTDVDKMLAAGFFAQNRSGDNAFSTGDANTLLLEQGIKVGNPSQCVKQNLSAKRVFAVHRNRYRVSQTGTDHLRQLLGSAFL
jgi:hypothetical protein